jgi:hypothetical protein
MSRQGAILMKTYEYYFLYLIKNKLTHKIYVGVHATDDLNDGYMGSGLHIKRAIEKYGIDNFERTIISFFDNEKDMFAAEKNVVTPEFVKENTNYNIAVGGNGGHTGNYNSKKRSQLISESAADKVMAKDTTGNIIKVSKDDPRFITKELVGQTSGKAVVKNKVGEVLQVDINDPRITSGELVGITKGYCTMKDVAGNILYVSKSDPRIASGELVGITAGNTQSEKSNLKRSNTLKGREVKHTRVSCIICKKSTILTNFVRWHNSCSSKIVS